MSPTQRHLDAVEVDDLATGVVDLVHRPEAPAVDGAHVDLEFAGQPLRVDRLVGVGLNRRMRRRVDVGPGAPTGADEGPEAAEPHAAGVLDVDPCRRIYTCLQFHSDSFLFV